VIEDILPPSRLIPFAIALLVAGVLGVLPAGAQAPTLTDISVDFSAFSPDGDTVQDVVNYRFTLGGIAFGDSADVHIEVQTGTETGPTGAVVKVLRNTRQEAGLDTVIWDGLSTSGILQPDAYYWFLATATTATDADTAVAVRVYLDTVAPQVIVVGVVNPYTPDIPGADSLARVTVDLSGVGNSDRLELILNGPKPGPGTASHFEDLTANGLLVVGWSGTNSADGNYGVIARVFDAAGHENQAAGPDLNLDVAPPTATITTPASPDTNDYIRRIAGEVTDRSGIQKLLITVLDASDSSRTMVDSLGCPCPQETVPFSFDVPDSVAQADTLIVDLFLVDIPGHQGGSSATFVVDTIPPPPPVFDPLPASVIRPDVEYAGTATEADSVYTFLDGFLLTGHFVRNDRFSGNVSLGQGSHTLQARAHDEAGNVSQMGPAVIIGYAPVIGVLIPERFRSGDMIQITLESKQTALFYDFPWDLTDSDGGTVGSGPYLFHITVDAGEGKKLEERLIAVVTR
jgi:hypothetical protein